MAPTTSNDLKALKTRAADKRPAMADENQSLSLALIGEQSPTRDAVERCIVQKFEASYGAHLTHFLPHLIRLGTPRDVGAVVGVNLAGRQDLFLEQYLDRPVEQAIAAAFMTPVDRDQVIEIGNLAAAVPGLAYALFGMLATVLREAGYKWVACTATPQVAAMLARLNFVAQPLCDADPAKLQPDTTDWGKYYATRPRVLAGDVQFAAAQAARNPDIAALLDAFWPSIRHLAISLEHRDQ